MRPIALVDFLVADADAGCVGARHLQLDQHQALEHLALQHVARRQLAGSRPAYWAVMLRHGAVELALQDHVFVDHGGDAVDAAAVAAPARSRASSRSTASENRRGRSESRKSVFMGIGSGSVVGRVAAWSLLRRRPDRGRRDCSRG